MNASPHIPRPVHDLAWLLRSAFRRSSRAMTTWVLIALGSGIAIPLQVWAGARAIDATGASSWSWFAVITVCLATTMVLDSLLAYVDAHMRERIAPALEADLYERLAQVDLALFEQRAFHDLSGRLARETEASVLNLNSLSTALSCIPRLSGHALMLGAMDLRLLALAVLPFLPNVWIWFRSGTTYWNLLSDQTHDRRLAAWYADRLTDRIAAKDIRLFGLAPHFQERWATHYWETRDQLRRQALWLAIRQRGANLVSAMVVVVGFIWLVVRLPAGISAGDVTVIVQAVISVPGIMFTLGEAVRDFGEIAGYGSDVRSVLALPTSVANSPPADARDSRRGDPPWSPAMGAMIRVDHRVSALSSSGSTPARGDQPGHPQTRGHVTATGLTFSYPGVTRPTIDDIDLEIAPGERVAIVGENGAGKTTLVKLLLGLYRPDRGTVAIDGEDLQRRDRSSATRRSAVFQQSIRYPFSLAENVTLGSQPESAAHDLDRVLDAAGVGDVVETLPEGAATLLSPDLGGIDLSGGQWQRVAIARAIWHDGDVLALDEPTATLDPMAEVEVFRRFAAISQGCTTLLISHRLGMARLADRIVVIEQGRIAESGTHDDLLRAGGIYAGMWAAQARWYL